MHYYSNWFFKDTLVDNVPHTLKRKSKFVLRTIRYITDWSTMLFYIFSDELTLLSNNDMILSLRSWFMFWHLQILHHTNGNTFCLVSYILLAYDYDGVLYLWPSCPLFYFLYVTRMWTFIQNAYYRCIFGKEIWGTFFLQWFWAVYLWLECTCTFICPLFVPNDGRSTL